MSVMVEKGERRLRNHSQGMDSERSRQVIEEWCRKLCRSCYPATIWHEVIKAALDGSQKMCQEEDTGVRPIHRFREWKIEDRRRENELKHISWHKRKEDRMSAPLLLNPMQGHMTKEMKDVCKKF